MVWPADAVAAGAAKHGLAAVVVPCLPFHGKRTRRVWDGAESELGSKSAPTSMHILPVVDSCEFAILHQLVPEVRQALSGEDLYRVG